MEPTTFVLLSGALTFGAPVLWAIHELVSLRRDRGGPGPRDRRPEPIPPAPRGGTPEHSKPLPACLIEAARGVPLRTRRPELEDA